MATWTNIPDNVLEPGKPIRSIDGLALRDNPKAIAEGATGAPRIQTAGYGNNTITGAKFNDSSVRSWIAGQAAGAVGTYAFVAKTSSSMTAVLWNSTIAGSQLQPTGVQYNNGAAHLEVGGSSLAGTWRVLGSSLLWMSGGGGYRTVTLAKRIS